MAQVLKTCHCFIFNTFFFVPSKFKFLLVTLASYRLPTFMLYGHSSIIGKISLVGISMPIMCLMSPVSPSYGTMGILETNMRFNQDVILMLGQSWTMCSPSSYLESNEMDAERNIKFPKATIIQGRTFACDKRIM